VGGLALVLSERPDAEGMRPTLEGLVLSEQPAAGGGRLRVEGQRPIDLRKNDNFRATSELVSTAVTVRDGEGRLVTTLGKDDFTVEEDGVPQPIPHVTKEL